MGVLRVCVHGHVRESRARTPTRKVSGVSQKKIGGISQNDWTAPLPM